MLSKSLIRGFHASRSVAHKVAVLGAAGGIGAPLSLLLKDIDAITSLALVDRSADVVGVAADCSHINTKAKVRLLAHVDAQRVGRKGAHLLPACWRAHAYSPAGRQPTRLAPPLPPPPPQTHHAHPA
jgi:hypothetical protein